MWTNIIPSLMVLALLPASIYTQLENSSFQQQSVNPVNSFENQNQPLQQNSHFNAPQDPDAKLRKISEAVTAEVWVLSRQYLQELQPAYVTMAASYIHNQPRYAQHPQNGPYNPSQFQRQSGLGHTAPSNDAGRNNRPGYQGRYNQNTQGVFRPKIAMKSTKRKLFRRESPKNVDKFNYKEGWY